jgi:hypothetical protein
MHSPYKYRPTLEDGPAFARKQEVHVKVGTVIAVIILAIGLGIAAKGDLPGRTAMAGPTSEFDPHTHLIASPVAFQRSAAAERDLPVPSRGDLQ